SARSRYRRLQVRVVALEGADQGGDDAKGYRLNQAVADISQRDGVVDSAPIRSFIDSEQFDPREMPAEDSDQIEEGGQYGKAYDRSQQAGRDEEAQRIDSHGVQSVDLLGVALDADLGRKGRAGLADNHNRGKDRPDFKNDREGDGLAEDALRTELCEYIVKLEAKNEPSEQADNQGDRHATHADFENGARDLLKAVSLLRKCDARLRSKASELAKLANETNAV